MRPVAPKYRVTLGYREEADFDPNYLHRGIDYGCPEGTPVYATIDGVVVHAAKGGGYGRAFGIHVVIYTGGIWHLYGHLSEEHVTVGQKVKAGQQIGESGATGNVTGAHLHYAEFTKGPASYKSDRKPRFIDHSPGPVDRMDPANYGTGHRGAHILWYGQRLELHGYGANYTPTEDWGPADVRKTREFQLAQDWTGKDADGMPGRETIRRLAAAPPPRARIDKRRWKITTPEEDEDGEPIEHYPFRADPPYCLDLGTRWRFIVPVDGARTENSSYPRCEGREMNLDGSHAAWTNRRGRHLLTGLTRVLELPGRKREGVIGQIHDRKDDVCMLLISGSNVVVSESLGKGKSKRHPLLAGYRLGDPLDWSIDATPTGILIRCNGSKVELKRICDDAYFKAAAYSQANEKNGTGRFVVEVERLEVSHT